MSTVRHPAALACALLLAGCVDFDLQPLRPDAGAEPADAAEPGPDASQDADAGLPGGPDATPARRLVPGRLLGDTPLQNLVLSPQLDPNTGLWYAMTSSYDELETRRMSYSRTPTGMPVLQLVGLDSRYVSGYVRGGKPPLLASIWVGRDAALPEKPISISIVGLPVGGTEDAAFELAADPDSVVQIDRNRWTRYSARIDQELLGVASMIVSDESAQQILLHAPVVVVDQTKSLAGPKPRRRAPSANEAAAIRSAAERLRRRAPREPIAPPL